MNKRELTRLHKRLCKELGVKPCRLIFRKQGRRPFAGLYQEHKKTITLYLDSIKRFGHDSREVLAHEVRHHFQYVTGITAGATWRGKSYLGEYRKVKDFGVGYNNLPWERDANRWARKIAKREGWV
jgi:hypothetical protein